MDLALDTTPTAPAAAPVAALAELADPAPESPMASIEPASLPRPVEEGETIIRALDVLLSAGLLLFFLPLMLLVAALLAPAGKIFFVQRRIGRDGREFDCLKFRSMVVDAETRLAHLLSSSPEARVEWAQTQKLRHDPRITPLGRFLRRTSLDELPQLFNILGGTMSIVGPRPIVRAEIARYGRYFSRYCAVKPGLTGLWQISGRSDVTYRRRVALDMLFVKSRSISIYLLIVVKTPMMVIATRGSY